jgi:hypothetical protein
MNFYNTLVNAKSTLVDMKAQLDKYKAKDNPSQHYINESERKIAHLSNFITTSEREVDELTLNRDYELADKLSQGIKRGREEAKMQMDYGRDNRIVSNEQRESIRAASKFNAINKWPELY